MTITSVACNNHRHAFEVHTSAGCHLLPYAQVQPAPKPTDRVAEVHVDDELGRQAFTYALQSGAEGSVHVEQVLEYNRDPAYMRDLLLYRLTLEAERRVVETTLSKREIARRLGTSPTQLYRLLDPTNYGKTVDSMLALLCVMGCEIDLVVRCADETAAARATSPEPRLR